MGVTQKGPLIKVKKKIKNVYATVHEGKYYGEGVAACLSG